MSATAERTRTAGTDKRGRTRIATCCHTSSVCLVCRLGSSAAATLRALYESRARCCAEGFAAGFGFRRRKVAVRPRTGPLPAGPLSGYWYGWVESGCPEAVAAAAAPGPVLFLRDGGSKMDAARVNASLIPGDVDPCVRCLWPSLLLRSVAGCCRAVCRAIAVVVVRARSTSNDGRTAPAAASGERAGIAASVRAESEATRGPENGAERAEAEEGVG